MNAITILHVEDDPGLAGLLQLTFEGFGFTGEFLTAATVAEGIQTIRERKAQRLPLDLIITDLSLPDGRGVEIIRKVKSNPDWATIPVLLLSSETTPKVVNEAYALGVNCYLPKSSDRDFLKLVKSLYQFWIECVVIPTTPERQPVHEILNESIRYKARVSQVFVQLSADFERELGRAEFFLELALQQSNLSNLMAFTRQSGHPFNISNEMLNSMNTYLAAKRADLYAVEVQAERNLHPHIEDAFRWSLELERTFNPVIVIEALAEFFPKPTAAASLFKNSTLCYISVLTSRVLIDSKDAGNRSAAESLQRLAANLA